MGKSDASEAWDGSTMCAREGSCRIQEYEFFGRRDTRKPGREAAKLLPKVGSADQIEEHQKGGGGMGGSKDGKKGPGDGRGHWSDETINRGQKRGGARGANSVSVEGTVPLGDPQEEVGKGKLAREVDGNKERRDYRVHISSH
ncbi:hypothetical protein ACHAWF_005845 [Thalassiosira exigua]